MARRQLNPFALSFLDCMCCGFGAVILVFMIISAKIQAESEEKLEGLVSDRVLLESRVLAGERFLAQIRGNLARAFKLQAVATHMKARLQEDLFSTEHALQGEEVRAGDLQARLEAQKKLLQALESSKQETGAMADQVDRQIRTIVGAGDRQYLTGMRMGGRRILVLVDASASMLAPTVVNVIRLRFLPDEQKLRSAKWKQVVETVDWLTANFPKHSAFQIYTFNTKATSLITSSGGAWIDVGDGSTLDEAVKLLRKTVPDDGTSLHAAFSVVARMNPRPDNVYLLVDGLPTHGRSPPRGPTVSGKQRLKNFERAKRELPHDVPVNVILFPMEGDPHAANSFWQLARETRGSFMSPSLDWP